MEQSLDQSTTSGSLSTPVVNITQPGGRSPWVIPSGYSAYHGSTDANLFSSSLPVLPNDKLDLTQVEDLARCSDDTSLKLDELGTDVGSKDSFDNLDVRGIGSLLPDDEEELLAGIVGDFDLSGLPNQVGDVEDYDLFGSGGGMELEFNSSESLTADMAKANINDGYSGNGSIQYGIPNGVGAVAGEHPYGEHPSRTLFVRNINSNVEDSELRSLFEQYGDIRTLYTACKHRGFVMISYYDIRAARTAMRALQNKPLRRRKLDIHFSIPKDNPSDKDINQGTLVVFNLDPSVSNDNLRRIFGAYGEVKEIRETPQKRHHKFIEFYDVRAAEAALRTLNLSDIAGKRIKLEPSRPGGARRNLIQQLSQDMEHEESRSFRHQVGSPVTDSPPGAWAQFSSPIDNSPLRAFSHSPNLGAGSPMASNNLPGLASILSPFISNSGKIAPIGEDQNRNNNADQVFSSSNSTLGVPFMHSRYVPEHTGGVMPNLSMTSGNVSSFGPSTSSKFGMGTLTGSQFLWGTPPYSERIQSSAYSTLSMGNSFTSNGQGRGFPYSSRHGSFFPSLNHQVGSAPSGIPLERRFGYFPESPDSPFMSPVGHGSMSIGQNEASMLMHMSSRARPINPGVSLSGNISENGSPGFRRMSPRLGHTFLGSAPYPGSGSTGMEGFFERSRGRRVDNNGIQLDSKKLYQLDLEKIISGEDNRTTLMIKNIPNKYTSNMILAAIDENHKGTYDFLYLPIDFKNKCNVGYAFINMVSPSHVVPFYQAFNGKKWEKFNSEKVASLAYARIQGKPALISHFQNSSLMNEDKRCRPILFHEGQETIDQELCPSNGLNIYVHLQYGSFSGDSPESSVQKNPDEKPDKSTPPRSCSGNVQIFS
ncbi:protein MEI2-like 2 isoform X1 [Iris pallida]|uniref:Protein MEI2-like 2 isoform X1 n=1 Tax=Iris pallida TaxID=29817 RepID=A0AAX6FYX6_IRIPA|nr:protein MEI2-like 2 isoform X1 [Iris pallida]